nr:uncharacterized protein LOC127488629 [Oryctolagus cuniculus]
MGRTEQLCLRGASDRLPLQLVKRLVQARDTACLQPTLDVFCPEDLQLPQGHCHTWALAILQARQSTADSRARTRDAITYLWPSSLQVGAGPLPERPIPWQVHEGMGAVFAELQVRDVRSEDRAGLRCVRPGTILGGGILHTGPGHAGELPMPKTRLQQPGTNQASIPAPSALWAVRPLSQLDPHPQPSPPRDSDQVVGTWPPLLAELWAQGHSPGGWDLSHRGWGVWARGLPASSSWWALLVPPGLTETPAGMGGGTE